MLAGLFEFLYGLIFGFLLLTICIIFLIFFVWCFPLPRNVITKNRLPRDKSELKESILWLDTICSNEPIHSAIQKKISNSIQTQITYFTLSSDSQSILRNISVLSTKFPSITSSYVKTSRKNDNTLVTTISLKLDSPLIVKTSSFVNSLEKEVISDITITQIDPTITLTIPYESGVIKADIDLGVDAEVDVNSAESIGAGDDVLKGIFIKIARRLDIKFSDDDDIFNEDDTNAKNAEVAKEDENERNEIDENFEEEEENIGDFDTVLRCDSYAQTMNRGKIDLIIPPYPSISITAVQPDQDPLINSNNQHKEIQTKENQTQTESVSSPLSFSKRKNQISIKPDESLLNQRDKKEKDENDKEKEKVKLSITKNRNSCFEVKQENTNQNTIHSEEIFEFYPEVPKIEEEEEDNDSDTVEESVTSAVNTSKRRFTVDVE